MLDSNVFIDSSIIVYSVDNVENRKRLVAEALLARCLGDGTGNVSTQVIGEAINVVLHRRKLLDHDGIAVLAETLLWPMCRVWPTPGLYADAISIHMRYGIQWWDALMIAGARASHCAVMFSEDLQHGQIYDGVRVLNPFLS